MSSTPSLDPGARDPFTNAPVRDHVADGIQEYDNNLPMWWQAIFYVTVVAAVFYVAYFHFGPGNLGPAAWAKEEKAAAEAKLARGGPPDEETLRKLSRDTTRVTAGAAVWAKAGCVACHGPEALGQVGPNLRDDKWKYGSDASNILETLTLGRNNNAMPAQGKILKQEELINLAIFIIDQNRTRKANGTGVHIPGEVDAPITY